MTSHDEFFTEQQPVAVFKHTLLSHYLTVWASKLGSRNPELAFIDGYAGAGQYDDGTPGSPLLALDISGKIAAQSSPKDLRCHFVEQQPEHAQTLRESIAQHPQRSRAQVYEGGIEDHLDGILTHVGERPTLVFLDPFGASFDADLLRETLLAKPGRKVEVLLNVSLTAVWRIGGQLAKNQLESRALTRLDTALGGEWWREEFIKAHTELTLNRSGRAASQASVRVADQFAQRLTSSRRGLRSLSVPLRKTLDRGPIFSLVLLYDHPDARMVFINAAASAHKAWRRHYWDDEAIRINSGDDTLFDVDLEREFEDEMVRLEEANVEAIKNNIRALLARGASGQVSDHAEAVFGTTIGTAGEKTMRRVLRELHTDGEIADSPVNVRPPRWQIRRP